MQTDLSIVIATMFNIAIPILSFFAAWSCVWTMVYFVWTHRYRNKYPDWWEDRRWDEYVRVTSRITAIAWFYLPKSIRP